MTRKLTNEEFLKRVYDLVGDEYEFLDQYDTVIKKMQVVHKICGYKYYVNANKFFGGRRCPKCANEKKSKDQAKGLESFIKEVSVLCNDEFIVSGDYKNNKKHLKFYHKVCGKEFERCPSGFLIYHWCPFCQKEKTLQKITKTHEQFCKEIYDLYGNEYQVIGKYVASDVHIKMKHMVCNNTWDVVPDSILYRAGCPKCKISRGEKRVTNFLKSHNMNDGVDYFPEYRFDDCRNKNPLPFDFYIPMFNIVIEYDGDLHYKPFQKELVERLAYIQK